MEKGDGTRHLPWQGLRGDTKRDKYEKIMALKMEMPVADLCVGLPGEFATYLEYTRNLRPRAKRLGMHITLGGGGFHTSQISQESF